MISPLVRLAGRDERILVGPETADDAGVYLLDGHALVATVDEHKGRHARKCAPAARMAANDLN